ncbi:MAG: toll/interleukin-1 receptor domain-containing protein [Fidelibacterota bacterium]
MSIEFKKKQISNLNLYTSNSYLFTREDLEYIFQTQDDKNDTYSKIIVDTVYTIKPVQNKPKTFQSQANNNENILLKVKNHDTFALKQSSDLRIKYCFWKINSTDDKWVFDITKPKDAILELPSRIEELLKTKTPVQQKKAKEKKENKTVIKENVITNNNTKIWITYAWADNKDNDVDFIAQELTKMGLEVKLDKWNINAGNRLWEQISKFIQDKNQSDAWILYATENSLGSEPCKEEFAYALDRALDNRGENYPIIGLFPRTIEKQLIPAGIKTRLYVSLSDNDWKERIKSSVEGRSPEINRIDIKPYVVRKHLYKDFKILEFRPRSGSWYPFIVGIPLEEKEISGAQMILLPGAPNNPPSLSNGFILNYRSSGKVNSKMQGKWLMVSPTEEATPSKSFFLYLKSFPSKVIFGTLEEGQYIVSEYE